MRDELFVIHEDVEIGRQDADEDDDAAETFNLGDDLVCEVIEWEEVAQCRSDEESEQSCENDCLSKAQNPEKSAVI